jgi:hypothetical protein
MWEALNHLKPCLADLREMDIFGNMAAVHLD